MKIYLVFTAFPPVSQAHALWLATLSAETWRPGNHHASHSLRLLLRSQSAEKWALCSYQASLERASRLFPHFPESHAWAVLTNGGSDELTPVCSKRRTFHCSCSYHTLPTIIGRLERAGHPWQLRLWNRKSISKGTANPFLPLPSPVKETALGAVGSSPIGAYQSSTFIPRRVPGMITISNNPDDGCHCLFSSLFRPSKKSPHW